MAATYFFGTPTLASIGSVLTPEGNQGNDEFTVDDVIEAYKIIYGDETIDPYLKAYYAVKKAAEEKDKQPYNILIKDRTFGWYGAHKYLGTTSWYIQIDDDTQNPFLAAFYLRKSFEQMREDNVWYAIKYSYAVSKEGDGLPDSYAYHENLQGHLRSAGRQAAMLTEIYLSTFGVVNEGADWAQVMIEVGNGNYSALLGLAPFVTAGGAKYLLKKVPAGKQSGKVRRLLHNINQKFPGSLGTIWQKSPRNNTAGKNAWDGLEAEMRKLDPNFKGFVYDPKVDLSGAAGLYQAKKGFGRKGNTIYFSRPLHEVEKGLLAEEVRHFLDHVEFGIDDATGPLNAWLKDQKLPSSLTYDTLSHTQRAELNRWHHRRVFTRMLINAENQDNAVMNLILSARDGNSVFAAFGDIKVRGKLTAEQIGKILDLGGVFIGPY